MYIQSFDEFAKGAFRAIFLGELTCNDQMLPSVTNGDPLRYIKGWLNMADMVIGNFKTTLSGETSNYPRLSSNDVFAKYLQGKVDLLFAANNHSADFGEAGVKRTYEVLTNAGFLTSGIADRKGLPHIIDKKLSNHTVAFLNYTTFINATEENKQTIYKGSDSQEASSGLISFYEQSQVEKDVDLAAKRSEFIIAGICQSSQDGDTKSVGRSTNKQRGRLLELAEDGVDVVIGSYPHNFQGAKLLDGGKAVVYSLGNCLSAMPTSTEYPVNSGCIMVMECDGFSNVQYSFLPTACIVEEQSGHYYVLPLFMLDGGGFSFLTPDQNQLLTAELQKIRQVLTACNLSEARIPIQYI